MHAVAMYVDRQPRGASRPHVSHLPSTPAEGRHFWSSLLARLASGPGEMKPAEKRHTFRHRPTAADETGTFHPDADSDGPTRDPAAYLIGRTACAGRRDT